MRVDPMNHYLDIHMRPDPELASYQLLSALYARLHRTLAKLGCQDIGVSFPAHDDRQPVLGTHLRLHGSDAALQSLMSTDWLHGMQDHLHISAPATVPTGARHRVVSRVQAKSNVERLRRRAIKRHGLDIAAAEQRIPNSAAERLRLPFVTLGSRSTGQPSFPLFIRHGPLRAEPIVGTFNSYGLSQQATVPWF